MDTPVLVSNDMEIKGVSLQKRGGKSNPRGVLPRCIAERREKDLMER